MPYYVRLKPGQKVRLADHDPDADGGLDKQAGREALAPLLEELAELQQELYAAGRHGALVILQGMDTSGKDGTIRNVFAGVNPQGCQVTPFKAPTAEELAHGFLWRVHKKAPPRSMIGVFNRSHYEDVLIARVHELVPAKVWRSRYEQINEFERLLVENDTIVCKFFLHISQDEQLRRLLAREQDVTKAYKLSPDDWRERERWDDYMAAYQDALRRCGTEAVSWYLIPANRKWYRNLAVAEALVETLRGYRRQWRRELERMSRERLAELAKVKAEAAGAGAAGAEAAGAEAAGAEAASAAG
jgi:PPK2 family polyphosphate:nucleotide phosphotransferase